MISLLEVLQKSTQFLQEREVPHAKLSAEWILAEALQLKRLDLYLQYERPLREDELEIIRDGIRRRSKREPLQYILGFSEFYGVNLKTDLRTLIPRPETEYLVEMLHTSILNRHPKRILDLGTGCGAIVIALLDAFPNAEAVGVDFSENALSLAAENADTVGVSSRLQLLQSDWLQSVQGQFDLIVSNPPYLTDQEMETLGPEVIDFEPWDALHGGSDGLNFLRLLLENSYEFLVDGGLIALETGINHHDPLKDKAQQVGYTSIQSLQDLDKRERFFLALR
ncbi:MAG: protein-(glutamine-N5) methyltransferase, release factor-specific [Opitutaceae bacterium]|nr:protein-(glutamine-N5) methyltransferase, release factor-specific [Opitutaceae bacterium]